VPPEITSPAGLAAVRSLAAALVSEETAAEEALSAVLDAIQVRKNWAPVRGWRVP
jgi:hypothetical protein